MPSPAPSPRNPWAEAYAGVADKVREDIRALKGQMGFVPGTNEMNVPGVAHFLGEMLPATSETSSTMQHGVGPNMQPTPDKTPVQFRELLNPFKSQEPAPQPKGTGLPGQAPLNEYQRQVLDRLAWRESTPETRAGEPIPLDEQYRQVIPQWDSVRQKWIENAPLKDYSAPNQIRYRMKNGTTSSASGRYQMQRGTYKDYAKRLGITDFKPEHQDPIAWNMAEEVYRHNTRGRDLYADAVAGKVNYRMLGVTPPDGRDPKSWQQGWASLDKWTDGEKPILNTLTMTNLGLPPPGLPPINTLGATTPVGKFPLTPSPQPQPSHWDARTNRWVQDTPEPTASPQTEKVEV